MEIKIGYALAKPVETQTQCDAYTTMVEAVNAHNAACAVGDMLWVIEDGTDSYTVAADVVVREPTAEELENFEPDFVVYNASKAKVERLAAREEACKKAKAREQLPDTVAALHEDNKTLKEENKMLKQCLMEMSEIVYA